MLVVIALIAHDHNHDVPSKFVLSLYTQLVYLDDILLSFAYTTFAIQESHNR